MDVRDIWECLGMFGSSYVCLITTFAILDALLHMVSTVHSPRAQCLYAKAVPGLVWSACLVCYKLLQKPKRVNTHVFFAVTAAAA